MQEPENHLPVGTGGVGRSGCVVAGLLLALLLLRVLLALWPFRSVVVTADPFSYVRFARDLAEGRFFVETEVSRAVEALWAGDQLTDGPVWNTHVRGDGRTVHTIAIGYPLVLAGAMRATGLSGALFLNHLLLTAVLGLLVLCVWEGWGRSTWALAFGAAAAAAFLYSAPASFLQFSRPWREPLFYLCVLGALYALFRFLREGRPGFVLLLGFLAGYACAIKEANIVYAAWMGLYLVCSRPFRAHPRKGLLLGLGVLGGLAGLAPLLIQNVISTGNPLLSLQFAHSASNYTAPPAEGPILGPVPGLTASNILSIYLRYIDLYAASGGALFQWPALLLCLAGVVLAIRSHAGRLFLGLGLFHALLYAQWGNADFRHMYFAHVSYAVLAALPLFLLLRVMVARVPALHARREPIFVALLAVSALFPIPFGNAPDEAERYKMSDAKRLEAELANLAEGRALFFSNRNLRDVLGTLTRLDVMRLLECSWFHPDEGIEQAVQWFLDQEVPLFLLDNVDQDPTRAGRFNLTQLDQERLRERFDLVEVLSIPADAFRLSPFLGLDRETLRVFKVEARQAVEVVRSLPVPEDGVAFLWLHPRSLGDRLAVRLDGQEVPATEPFHYFRPLASREWGEAVSLEATADGVPVPGLRDARLLGWHETVTTDFGPDAMPGDAPWLAHDPGDLPWVSERRLDLPFSLQLPVRASRDFFTFVGLGIRWLPEAGERPEALLVRSMEGGPFPMHIYGDTVWFPLGSPNAPSEGPWAGVQRVRLEAEMPARVGLRRARVLTAHRVLRLVPDSSTIGIGLVGLLAPETPEPGPHAWHAEANGVRVAEGTCTAQPRRPDNRFSVVLEASTSATPMEVQMVGAGLLDPEWVEVGARLHLLVGDASAAFLADGFYGEESMQGVPFQWSGGESGVRVPFSKGLRRYRLTLDLADGRPEPLAQAPRRVRATVAGTVFDFALPMERSEIDLNVEMAFPEASGLGMLRFECPTWVPSEALGSHDDRALGFQLFALGWAPIGEQAGATPQ